MSEVSDAIRVFEDLLEHFQHYLGPEEYKKANHAIHTLWDALSEERQRHRLGPDIMKTCKHCGQVWLGRNNICHQCGREWTP